MPRTYSIELEGRQYTWGGKSWVDAKTCMVPPLVVTSRLNHLLKDQLAQDDAGLSGIQEMLEKARKARDGRQFERAVTLAERALAQEPGHCGALAILCSSLRARHAPERALAVTDAYRHLDYPPLLVSRAAAMCDLGMWAEARREIGRALALRTRDAEAFRVMGRIKAARPDLCGPEGDPRR